MTIYQNPEQEPRPKVDPKPEEYPLPAKPTQAPGPGDIPHAWEMTDSKKVDDLSRHESKHDAKHDPNHDAKHDAKHDSRQKPENAVPHEAHPQPGTKPLPGHEKK